MTYTDMILVIRNHRGLNETNHVLTLDDFFRMFNGGQTSEDMVLKLDAALAASGTKEKSESVEIYLRPNDTIMFWRCRSRDELMKFLRGVWNDDATDMVLRNVSDAETLADTIKEYQDWYWEIGECSSDILKYMGKDTAAIRALKNSLPTYIEPGDLTLCVYDELEEGSELKEAAKALVAKYEKRCAVCGKRLLWGEHDCSMYEVSENYDNWPMCLDCMREYCSDTTCSMCDYRDDKRSREARGTCRFAAEKYAAEKYA